MKLCKRDEGKAFIAPSGRLVWFVQERNGSFIFTYDDDPLDGLSLSFEGLRILERPTTQYTGTVKH
jgi:hypothetical protein